MMSHSPLARSEAGLAYAFLLPPLAVVISIVLVPVLANFWISFKAVELSDLRPPNQSSNFRLVNGQKNTEIPLFSNTDFVTAVKNYLSTKY